MLPSKLHYGFRVTPYFVSIAPVSFFHAFARFILPTQVRHGIYITSTDIEHPERFIERVEQALNLIAKHDEFQYGHVRNEICRIIQMPNVTAGQYYRLLKVCVVDLRTFSFEPDVRRADGYLACVLVHEATHGQLFRRRIMFSKRNLPRIEQICCREMRRFAGKIGLDPTTWDETSGIATSSFRGRMKFLPQAIKRLWLKGSSEQSSGNEK